MTIGLQGFHYSNDCVAFDGAKGWRSGNVQCLEILTVEARNEFEFTEKAFQFATGGGECVAVRTAVF